MKNRPAPSEIRIGISSCLLGEAVRYDGGHKRDAFAADLLQPLVVFVPVCPEVELGLGIPRPPIRLVDSAGETRLVSSDGDRDLTEAMLRYAERRVRALDDLDLSGYILKSRSPSCGMERVPVHPENGGAPAKKGRGLFARVLLEKLPLLPVEEEGRLNDPRLRENFLERVFAYRRLRAFFRETWSAGGLVRFHTAEKLLLLAHFPEGYRALGRLVAGAKDQPRRSLAAAYQQGFMAALARRATPGRHADALRHMAGHFKRLLDADERRELAEVIGDFQKGLVPLIVPITLIRHHVRRHGVEYLEGQTYLDPHPKELLLRNHV